jgi:hypothetical protein
MSEKEKVSAAGYNTMEASNPIGSIIVTVKSSNLDLKTLIDTAIAATAAYVNMSYATVRRFSFRLAATGTVYWAIGRAANASTDIALTGQWWSVSCDKDHMTLVNFIAGGDVSMEVLWVE